MRYPRLTCTDWDEVREPADGEAEAATAVLDALQLPDVTWTAHDEGADLARALDRTIRVEILDGALSHVHREVPENTFAPTWSPFFLYDRVCPQGDLVTLTGQAQVTLLVDGEAFSWVQPAVVDLPAGNMDAAWVAFGAGGSWSDAVPPDWLDLVQSAFPDDVEIETLHFDVAGHLGEGGGGEAVIGASAEADYGGFATTVVRGSWGAP